MTDTELRLRRSLADSFALVVAALVVFALLGGWLAYTTHVSPGSHVEERTTASWEATGDFRYSATVTNGTIAFPEGEVLTNRSVYFTSVSPVLDGSFVYTYTAAEGDLTVNTTLVLVLHAVGEGSDGTPIEYWRVTRRLGNDRAASLAPGETLAIPFSRDVNATRRLGERIEGQVGSSEGTVEALLTARVRFDGQVEGQSVSGTRTYRLPIGLEDGRYRVDDPGSIDNRSRSTERVRVTNEYGPLRGVGSVLLLVTSLALLAGLVVSRRAGRLEPSETERERLVYTATRDEFDDWITAASPPQEAFEAPRVEVDSLDGLVDLAIDTNRRVIEDADRGEYLVLGDGVIYTYTPARRSIDFEFERS
jgi:membrane-associated protease RseP (regulator of RpoE activity)